MAQRDRTQGFGFVYVDIATLLAQRDQFERIPTDQSPSVNFNKDPRPAKAKEEVPDDTKTDLTRQRVNAINQIKNNLDRLQSLHHKLHVMLEELNQITDREKRKRR